MKFLPLMVALAAGHATAADIQSFDLSRPEGSRHYLLATPARKPTTRRPLVILLHGHTGTARQLLGQGMGAAPLSVWLDIADREGLVLIAPDGAKGNDDQQGWNDCRADASSNPKTDDVGFIAALISQAVAQQQVDPQRVYVMGMSNGGMMAFRLAAELPDKITAIAAVGSSMAAKSQCKTPAVKLSVLIISGDADPLVPYAGGEVRFFSQKTRGSVIGIEPAANFWRELDQLPERPALVSTFEHRDADDKTRATRTRWGGDPQRYQVELVKISEGGHVEPSASKRIGALYRSIVGAQNSDFEAAEEAWAFFQSKARD
jgi:polyhydroxybutyrate depolymerase